MKPVLVMLFLLGGLNATASDLKTHAHGEQSVPYVDIFLKLSEASSFGQALAIETLANSSPVLQAEQISLQQRIQGKIVRNGEYEWNVNSQIRRRRDRELGLSGNDQEIGLIRTVRLPSKRIIDEQLSEQYNVLADVLKEDAWHENARRLNELWFDLRLAKRKVLLLEQLTGEVAVFVSQQGKRFKAGEVSRVEFEQSQLPLSALEADSLQAKAAMQVARVQLLNEFPRFNQEPSVTLQETGDELELLPNMTPGEQDAWKSRLVEQNHALELQRKQTELRHALLNRAQADRMADPTVGMHLTRERDNAEQIVSLSVFLPLGGELRESRAAIAQAQYAQSSVQEAQAQRAAFTQAAQLLIHYQSQRETRLRLNGNAQKARSLLLSLKKAFDVGEISQTELNLARQQAIQTQLESIKAQTQLEKLVGELLIDAHLSWVGP
jgi:hypothetical protein